MKVLVTAGPTREFVDPVRFLSNPSSGKMGTALATAARDRGARVTLVIGPVSLQPPSGVRLIRVMTAEEMYRAVMKEGVRAEIILMTAAVSDYRPLHTSPHKLKKGKKRLFLPLIQTRDILKELGLRKKRGQILVGFAAETDHLVQNAIKKMKEKNLDMIIANLVGGKNSGFESDLNRGLLVSSGGVKKILPLLSKKKLASQIIKTIRLL